MKRNFCFFREKKKKKDSEKLKKLLLGESKRKNKEAYQNKEPNNKIPNNMLKIENKYEDLWKKKNPTQILLLLMH